MVRRRDSVIVELGTPPEPWTNPANPVRQRYNVTVRHVLTSTGVRSERTAENSMSNQNAETPQAKPDGDTQPPSLHKSLKNRHIQLIALEWSHRHGSVYGSSESISGTEHSVAYVIGGLAIFLMRARDV